jgi:DNA polymerase (family X)
MKGWKYDNYRHSLAAKGIKTVFKKGKVYKTKSGPEVIKLARLVKDRLSSQSKRIDIAGSIRRGKKDPVDVDIVMIPKNKAAVKAKLESLGEIEASGNSTIQTRIKGVDVDVYFADGNDYGAQLMTRTGPWQGNLGNRTLAKNRGLKLNQYGLWKGNKRIAGKTEASIYRKLGKKYKEPNLRGF